MPSPRSYGFSDSMSEPATALHTLEIEETLALLSSDRNAGLTSQEAIERLQRYGANEIQEAGGRSPLSILVDQFTNIMLLMLIAVAVVSAILALRAARFPKDAIAIFARGLKLYIIRIGVIFAILTIALMAWAYNYAQNSGDPNRWKTMVFTTLCLAQLGHAIAIRSNTQLTLELNSFSNPYVLSACTLTSVLQLMLVYVAPLRDFFNLHWLNPLELSISIGFSALMFVWIELEKLFIKWFLTR